MSDAGDPKSTSYKDDPDFLPWLRQQPGFADLFAAPEPAGKAAPTRGGGQDVPANQMQAAAGNLVTDLVGAVTEAAVRAGRKEGSVQASPAAAPAPPAAKPKQSAIGEFLFGKDEE
jgi:hypothetical protein